MSDPLREALEKHPRPWTFEEYAGGSCIKDANGEWVMGGDSCEGYIDPDVGAFVCESVNRAALAASEPGCTCLDQRTNSDGTVRELHMGDCALVLAASQPEPACEHGRTDAHRMMNADAEIVNCYPPEPVAWRYKRRWANDRSWQYSDHPPVATVHGENWQPLGVIGATPPQPEPACATCGGRHHGDKQVQREDGRWGWESVPCPDCKQEAP